MGCCPSSEDSDLDAEVTRELHGDKTNIARVQKLLFLGAGGSGKSTFFKQLKCIHGRGFSTKDRIIFKEHIASQIIEQINRAIESIPFVNETLADNFEPICLSDEAQESAELLADLDPEQPINEEIAAHIKKLWSEEAIQTVYENRALLKLDDSSAYFFNEIDRIGQCSSYLPSDKDILLVRYRTTGVVESHFKIMGSDFDILDVGGQQSERKKWIHCFENVTAVIYVASLSAYDEVMFEEDGVNVMEDSLLLFTEICENQWFVTTPIILFLNKDDIFIDKIKQVPITVCFPDFETETQNSAYDEEACRDYIAEKYKELNINNRRTLHIHVTTATDKSNVLVVFNDVQQMIVQRGLERNNLI